MDESIAHLVWAYETIAFHRMACFELRRSRNGYVFLHMLTGVISYQLKQY